MELGLKGKVAIVTGGTSGIGLAISRRLLAEGAKVFVCGREADRLAAALEGFAKDDEIAGTRADVGNPEDAARLVGEAVERFGGLDVVINNAGTHLRGSLDEVAPDRVEAHFRTKVMGPWEIARHAAPHMKKRGGGRVILVIGQAGKVPGRQVLGSAVVNAAQHAFVKSLSDDLGRFNILVNAVCPSRIESPLTANLVIDDEVYLGRSLEQQESRWGASVPMGRWGQPDDIADAVVFMASDRAAFVCGANIDVDGGHQRMVY